MDIPKTPHELLDPPSDGEFAAGEANVVSDEDRVVIDIKIATDYDDMLQFQNEGYEVFCTPVLLCSALFSVLCLHQSINEPSLIGQRLASKT